MKLVNDTLLDAAALPLPGPKGENLLTVIVKGTFAFDSDRGEPAHAQLPIAYGDVYRDEEEGGGMRYESDIVPFKPRTDIVLEAAAYAPDGEPAQVVPVAVKVGPVEKRIIVFGERFWNYAGVLSRAYVITATKPFVRKPIQYSDAFGGMDENTGEYCAENLAGIGLYSSNGKNLAGKPLPCIEDPRHLIRSIGDRPPPVGFGFYQRAWQPRAAYAGTYDAAWRKRRSPLPPEDFDPRFYNSAHPDLQSEGYLRGDEPVELINLTSDGRAAFRLPDVHPMCAVARKENKGHCGKEVTFAMNLDTLFIDADARRNCLVWRWSLVLMEPSAAELDWVRVDIRQK